MTKVLIVDNDEKAASDVGGHLRHMGFRVDYAADGEDCLKRIEKYTPNIIISEVDLPKVDGLALLKKLKENDKTKHIPVLFLTNIDDQQKRSEAARLGVTVYFIKSQTSKDVLVNWVQELIATNSNSNEDISKEKKKISVLIVDSDSLSVNLYQKLLKYEGFDVAFAIDGDIGLKKAKENTPDIILLDILMPSLEGMEMLKNLNSDPLLKAIPVVMLANSSGVKYAKESLTLGAKDYIIKSEHDQKDVITIVKRVLKQRDLKEE